MARSKCNVPGCGKNALGRGLCGTHYTRAMKGRAGPEKDEALAWASEPKGRRGGKDDPPAGKRPPGQDADGLGPDADADRDENAGVDPVREKYSNRSPAAGTEPAAVPHAKAVERIIGTVAVFASNMGLGRPTFFEATGERTWVSPINDTEIMLDADGHLHSIRRTVGAAIEI